MQLDDRPIPSYPSSASDSPGNDSANQTPDVRAESEMTGQQQQRLIRTSAGRQNSPRFDPTIEAILDRACAAERQSAAARRTHAEADARLRRAEEAWLRVALFKGDRIPRGLSPEALRRCYAQLIVQLGSVLKADGWHLETVSPGPDAKAYALAILRRAMDGDLDSVEEMVKQGIATLFHLGLAADAWLGDGLRYEVLNVRPPAESPFSWMNSAIPPVDNEPSAGEPRVAGAVLGAHPEPVSPRLAGRPAAEARVTQYLAGKRDPLIAEAARATGLTERKIQRTQSWKEHEEGRLDAFLREDPQACTGDVKEAFDFSPSKTVKMRAWKEHQARREAAKPPHRVKERRLSKSILRSRPDAAAVDPAARVADREQILQTIWEDADPETKALIKRLTGADREALLDHVVGSTDRGDGLDTAHPAANRALLLEITKQWLDEHEQEARRSSRLGSAR